MTFSITTEQHAPHVLLLRGHLGGGEAPELDAVGAEALARSSSGLVLDVTDLVSFDDAGVASINRLGAIARVRRGTVTVRTPEGHLEEELTGTGFEQGVRVEVTQLVQLATAGEVREREEKKVAPVVPTEPTVGTARRAGRGFVASFGDGRVCAVKGCTTRLSQYNGSTVCAVHEQGRRGRE